MAFSLQYGVTGNTVFTVVTWVLLTTIYRVVQQMLFSRKVSVKTMLFQGLRFQCIFLWSWGSKPPPSVSATVGGGGQL